MDYTNYVDTVLQYCTLGIFYIKVIVLPVVIVLACICASLLSVPAPLQAGPQKAHRERLRVLYEPLMKLFEDKVDLAPVGQPAVLLPVLAYRQRVARIRGAVLLSPEEEEQVDQIVSTHASLAIPGLYRAWQETKKRKQRMKQQNPDQGEVFVNYKKFYLALESNYFWSLRVLGYTSEDRYICRKYLPHNRPTFKGVSLVSIVMKLVYIALYVYTVAVDMVTWKSILCIVVILILIVVSAYIDFAGNKYRDRI